MPDLRSLTPILFYPSFFCSLGIWEGIILIHMASPEMGGMKDPFLRWLPHACGLLLATMNLFLQGLCTWLGLPIAWCLQDHCISYRAAGFSQVSLPKASITRDPSGSCKASYSLLKQIPKAISDSRGRGGLDSTSPWENGRPHMRREGLSGNYLDDKLPYLPFSF